VASRRRRQLATQESAFRTRQAAHRRHTDRRRRPHLPSSIRSTMNLARDWLLNLDLRRIGALPSPASPAYTELRRREIRLTVFAIGGNLPQRIQPHPSAPSRVRNDGAPLQLGSTGVESGRSFLLESRWRF